MMMELNIMIYMIHVSLKKLIKEYDYFKNKEYKEIETDVFKKFTQEELNISVKKYQKHLKVKQKTL
jgi:hypothetical protein